MSNGLKQGKLAEKYFCKLKDLETDMNKENIKKIQEDFTRSECTRTTGRGEKNKPENSNNHSAGKQKKLNGS